MNKRATTTAAFVLALMSTFAIPAGCAHVNSPGGFVQCMADSKDESAALQLLYAALDQNAVGAIEAALRIAPDAIRCLLERTATAKGAGPVEQTRAARAREFLEAHPKVSNLFFKKGGGVKPAAGVGPLPSAGPAANDAPPATTAADDAVAFHWALPFEQTQMLVNVWNFSMFDTIPRKVGCADGMHLVAVPPWVPNAVCVTDDFTFDLDVWVASQAARVPRHAGPLYLI